MAFLLENAFNGSECAYAVALAGFPITLQSASPPLSHEFSCPHGKDKPSASW